MSGLSDYFDELEDPRAGNAQYRRVWLVWGGIDQHRG